MPVNNMLLTPSLLRDYVAVLDTVRNFDDFLTFLPSKLSVAAAQATENAEGGSDNAKAHSVGCMQGSGVQLRRRLRCWK